MASLALIFVAWGILVIGPRLSTASWTHQTPRLAVAAWLVLTVGAVLAVVVAGVTLLIPVSAFAADLCAAIQPYVVETVEDEFAQLLPGRLLGTLIAGVVSAWFGICWTQVLIGRRRRRRDLRRSLGMVVRPHDDEDVVVIDAPTPAAFCVSGPGQRIFITQGALDVLSARELEGVLAHERAHLRGRHHLVMALLESLSRAFPRVDLFRTATEQTRQLIELLADDAASGRVGRLSLASAIVSLAEMRAPNAALGMAQEGAVLRVSRLLAPPPAPGRYRVQAVSTVAVVVASLLIAGFPALCVGLGKLCNVL